MDHLEKEVYRRLKSGDDILTFFLDYAMDGIWYWDPSRSWVSSQFWGRLGYQVGPSGQGQPAWSDVIHPDDLAALSEGVQRQMASSEEVFDQIVRYKHSNGSTVWVRSRGNSIRDEEGKLICMIGTHTDVSKEKEYEAQLLLQNSLLRSSIESFKDVLIFSVDRDYRYQMYNEAFRTATYRVYGIDVAKGMSMLESIPNLDDREKAKGHCDRAFAGESHVNIEVYGQLTRLFFETRYNPIIEQDGSVVGVTVLSTDITERKLAEERLYDLNREMESFSYTASHDLRAPLRAISSYVQILREDFGQSLDPEALELTDSIMRNAERMGALIDDLLRYSRLGRKELVISRVNMNEVMKSALREVQDYWGRDLVDVKIHDLVPATGDKTLLRQVWANLISNAYKYSSKENAPKIEIGCTVLDGEASYWITDNGVGFDMAYYDKIFGVFQRLHSGDEFEGSGVGLAIVQRIVSRLGGRVSAQSSIGNGATFYFYLPLVAENQ